MKKVFYPLACLAAGALVACGGQKSGSAQADQPNEVALAYSKSLKAPETDSLKLPVDENGYITIFDGKTFDGWRGYGKDKVPAKWTIEDGCIKFNGTGGGEAQDADGGDLIFAHKFKNFELELEWKVAKGSNSGILYLAQEITSKDKDGNDVLEPIYISAPEYQILDNANHPDAKLGKDNNRQSASLYDGTRLRLWFIKVQLSMDKMMRMYLSIICGQNNGLICCRQVNLVKKNGLWHLNC